MHRTSIDASIDSCRLYAKIVVCIFICISAGRWCTRLIEINRYISRSIQRWMCRSVYLIHAHTKIDWQVSIGRWCTQLILLDNNPCIIQFFGHRWMQMDATIVYTKIPVRISIGRCSTQLIDINRYQPINASYIDWCVDRCMPIGVRGRQLVWFTSIDETDAVLISESQLSILK